jgi:polysaccharide export outer membrane protein
MTDPGRVSETPAASFAEDYKLGVGDKIRVIVYNEEALSGEFEVNGAGKVSLPLVGEMVASGQTTEQIADALRNTLSQGYLRDPHVSVEVLTYRPYFILGEIKTPAQYPYVNGMTVMNAIATAGGFTPRAARKRVYIRRSGEGEEKVFDLTPDLRIYPGDTVRLGERYF